MQTSSWEMKNSIANRMLAYVAGRDFKEGKARFIAMLEMHLKIAKEITVEDFSKATGSTID